MKAITVSRVEAGNRPISVKKLLITVIIYLTSEKFFIFASVTGALIAYVGLLINFDLCLAYGAIAFLIGFTPWSWRQTCRYLRQDEIEIKH